ncbi:MAG: hypothetical protein GX067_09545 [Clostridiales bacterium]|nr:hypothetical protein [Clostridiales bacterium]
MENTHQKSVETTAAGKTKTQSKLFDIAERENLVAICYSTWFNPILDEAGGAGHPIYRRYLPAKPSGDGCKAFIFGANRRSDITDQTTRRFTPLQGARGLPSPYNQLKAAAAVLSRHVNMS